MPIEVVDPEDESKPAEPATKTPTQPPPSAPSYPGGYPIDVAFEASKLPLDVGIFNSARAAGGEEKIRKYLQAVLVVGGTALIPGMAHALESRQVLVLVRYRFIHVFLGCRRLQLPWYRIWRRSR